MRDDSKSGREITKNLRPISYASKTLSTTESNYSNIECELLGLLFAITHFKHFTNGRLVHIITDHKTLVSLIREVFGGFITQVDTGYIGSNVSARCLDALE